MIRENANTTRTDIFYDRFQRDRNLFSYSER
jgi:hypothetical protein